MKIYRDSKLEENIIKQIQDNWDNKEREGIHLSDLLTPRQAYFKRVDPRPPSIEDILYFMSGNAIEGELLKLLKLPHGETKVSNGVYYSVDTRIPEITEIKSRRMNLPKPGNEAEDFEHYLHQLGSYIALDGQNKGNLLVVSLAEKVDSTHKTKPVLAAYKVDYEEDDLKFVLEDLEEVRARLELALQGKEVENLPECPTWMCGKEIKTMVKKPYCKTCKKEFATDWGIEKHKHGIKTEDHKVTMAKYEYGFEPRCKWFTECREIFYKTEG